MKPAEASTMKDSSMKILTIFSLVIIVLIFTYSNVHAANVNAVGIFNISPIAQLHDSTMLDPHLATGNSSTVTRQGAVIRLATYTCQTDSPYGWTCEESGYASPGDTCWCFGPPPAYGHVIRSS